MSLTATTFIAEGSLDALARGESLAVCIGVSPPMALMQQAGREGLTVLSSPPLSLPSGSLAQYRYVVVSGGRIVVRFAPAACPPPLPAPSFSPSPPPPSVPPFYHSQRAESLQRSIIPVGSDTVATDTVNIPSFTAAPPSGASAPRPPSAGSGAPSAPACDSVLLVQVMLPIRLRKRESAAAAGEAAWEAEWDEEALLSPTPQIAAMRAQCGRGGTPGGWLSSVRVKWVGLPPRASERSGGGGGAPSPGTA